MDCSATDLHVLQALVVSPSPSSEYPTSSMDCSATDLHELPSLVFAPSPSSEYPTSSMDCTTTDLHEMQALVVVPSPSSKYPTNAYNSMDCTATDLHEMQALVVVPSPSSEYPTSVYNSMDCTATDLHEMQALVVVPSPSNEYPTSAYNSMDCTATDLHEMQALVVAPSPPNECPFNADTSVDCTATVTQELQALVVAQSPSSGYATSADDNIMNCTIAEPGQSGQSPVKSHTNPNVSNYCIFCHMLIRKYFWEHMTRKHKSQSQIEMILSYRPSKRREEIKKFRMSCTKTYNRLHPRSPLIARTCKSSTKIKLCTKCGVGIASKNYNRHYRSCSALPTFDSDDLTEVSRVAQVLHGGRDDALKKIYNSDPVLLLYAEDVCVGVKWDSTQANNIRQRLRRMSEILLKMRSLDNSITDCGSIFHPDKWATFKRAVVEYAGVNENGEIKHPSVLTSTGFFFKRVADVLLVRSNVTRAADIRGWLSFYALEHYRHMAKIGIATSRKRRRNKIHELPKPSDVVKIEKFLDKTIRSCAVLLRKNFSLEKYNTLSKALACSLVSFNRRRPQEVQRLLLQDYSMIHTVPIDKNVKISQREQTRATEYKRLELGGKGQNTVCILFPNEIVKNINLLISLRDQTNIPKVNPFVFATNSNTGTVSVNKALVVFSVQSGAEKPKLLRSTKFRTLLAMSTQQMNLTEEEKRIVSQFLGHSRKVHEKYYNIPDPIIQVTQVSNMLDAVSQNRTEDFRGKRMACIGQKDTSRKRTSEEDEGEEDWESYGGEEGEEDGENDGPSDGLNDEDMELKLSHPKPPFQQTTFPRKSYPVSSKKQERKSKDDRLERGSCSSSQANKSPLLTSKKNRRRRVRMAAAETTSSSSDEEDLPSKKNCRRRARMADETTSSSSSLENDKEERQSCSSFQPNKSPLPFSPLSSNKNRKRRARMAAAETTSSSSSSLEDDKMERQSCSYAQPLFQPNKSHRKNSFSPTPSKKNRKRRDRMADETTSSSSCSYAQPLFQPNKSHRKNSFSPTPSKKNRKRRDRMADETTSSSSSLEDDKVERPSCSYAQPSFQPNTSLQKIPFSPTPIRDIKMSKKRKRTAARDEEDSVDLRHSHSSSQSSSLTNKPPLKCSSPVTHRKRKRTSMATSSSSDEKDNVERSQPIKYRKKEYDRTPTKNSKVPWTSEETAFVMSYFKKNIEFLTSASYNDARKCRLLFSPLKSRISSQIVNKVNNVVRKLRSKK